MEMRALPCSTPTAWACERNGERGLTRLRASALALHNFRCDAGPVYPKEDDCCILTTIGNGQRRKGPVVEGSCVAACRGFRGWSEPSERRAGGVNRGR